MAGLPYKTFKVTHPEYDSHYWARCRALYAGGHRLKCNQRVFEELFPKHNAEAEHIYEERKARAFYLNYAGSVIDLIVAGLFEEQPSMEGTPEPDKWYGDWFADVSRPGGKVVSFTDLLKSQVLTALQLKRAWTLVELPQVPESEPQSLADQEQAGALDCYACAIEPECVRDWEMDEDGRLAWVLLAFQRQKRADLTAGRDTVEEEFVYYSPTNFARYAISYPCDKPPRDTDEVPLVAEGPHSFGRVPVATLELTDGMWAMSKLEGIAAAHLNTVCALNWATIKSLFPTPTAFLAPVEVGNEITENTKRATTQARSPAHIVTLGKDDRVEFVGPSPEPFAQAGAQLDRLRDEMYRVVHSMAASVDNSGAALQRSGKSKQMDQTHTTTVLKWLGEAIAKHAVEVVKLVGAGRGDPEIDWVVHGMEEFGKVDLEHLLDEATAVETLSINSPTFQTAYKFKVAKEVLGDDADGATLDKIKDELESNNPPEMYDPANLMAANVAKAEQEQEPDDGDKMPMEEKPENAPPPPPPPKAKKGKGKKAKDASA